MWLRVAEFLHATPTEARMRCTVRDFIELAAFYLIDPWTRERDDLHAGVIASVMANIHSKNKRHEPKNFMPKFIRARKTPQEMGKWFANFAQIHNSMRGDKGDG